MVDIIKLEPSPKTRKSLALWQDRIKSCIKWRREVCFNGDKVWRRCYELFAGKHWSQADVNQTPTSDLPAELIRINRINSTIEDFLPFYLRREPEFLVRTKTERPDATTIGQLQSRVLNYFWHEKSINDQVRAVLQDWLIIGHGVVKTGFARELNIDKVGEKRQGFIDYNEAIRSEEPFAYRINPFKFYYDPNASDHTLGTARFTFEIITRPIADIVSDRRYSQSVRNDIISGKERIGTAKSFLSAFQDDKKFNFLGVADDIAKQEMGILYEVLDKKFQKYYIFADNILQPLIDDTWPYDYLDSFNYVMFRFKEIPDQHYPIGLPFLLQDIQVELNRHRTKAYHHMRSTNRRYEYNPDTIGDEISKFESEAGIAVIANKDPTGAPGIRPIPEASMSFDTERFENLMDKDWRELSGSDALARGGPLPARTTATEINTRAQLFGLKSEGKVEIVDACIAKIGRQLLQHIQANAKRDLIIRILGKNIPIDQPVFQTVTPEDIQHEFELDVRTVSVEAIDPQVDRQQRLQALQTLISMAQAGYQGVDFNELIAWVMESFDIKDISRFIPSGVHYIAPVEGGNGQTARQVSTELPPNQTRSRAQPGPTVESSVLGSLLGQLNVSQ